MRRVLAVALLAAWPAAVPVLASHGEVCSAAGAQPAIALGDVHAFAGVLDPSNGYPSQGGAPHKWTITVGPGTHYLFMDGTGDADVIVCVPGAFQNRHVCSSSNVAFYPDNCFACHSGNPHSGCPIDGPGDFVIYVIYCSGLACGYPLDVPVLPYAGVVTWSPL